MQGLFLNLVLWARELVKLWRLALLQTSLGLSTPSSAIALAVKRICRQTASATSHTGN